MHPWVQIFYLVFGLGSGGIVLGHLPGSNSVLDKFLSAKNAHPEHAQFRRGKNVGLGCLEGVAENHSFLSVLEGHHPVGTALPEAHQGNLLPTVVLKGLCASFFEGAEAKPKVLLR